eukprot:4125115-Prymnesium_polylepis.1
MSCRVRVPSLDNGTHGYATTEAYICTAARMCEYVAWLLRGCDRAVAGVGPVWRGVPGCPR